jgi:hypothetical protein
MEVGEGAGQKRYRVDLHCSRSRLHFDSSARQVRHPDLRRSVGRTIVFLEEVTRLFRLKEKNTEKTITKEVIVATIPG